MVYTIEQQTPSYLCDRNDKLHIWAAVRLCQEVTEYHGNSTGIGYSELLEQNRAWVIVRSYYEIYRRADSFEKISWNTWSRGTDGLFAFRDYRVNDAEGNIIMTGTSYWTLIDFSQRRAVRIKDAIKGYGFVDDFATDRHSLGKLTMPSFDESDTAFSIIARNSLIDHTQHVNNSEYIKMIFDALADRDFDMDKPLGIELNFQHETKPGDTLTIRIKESEGSYYAQAVNSQGVSVNAVVKHIAAITH